MPVAGKNCRPMGGTTTESPAHPIAPSTQSSVGTDERLGLWSTKIGFVSSSWVFSADPWVTQKIVTTGTQTMSARKMRLHIYVNFHISVE
jgi:hypothetical protein